MEFEKISEQNAWNAVEQATRDIRDGGGPTPELVQWFKDRGIDVSHAVFPCFGQFDENTYSGTLVDQNRHVYEYFVDLTAPDEGDLDDVTDELGPKDPSHPQSDIKDLITMALVYYDAQRGKAA